MSQVPHDVMAFDVERGLARALGIRVETYVCGSHEFKYRIGLRWDLVLDAHQLGELWNNADNSSALRDTFDGIKAECLVFRSLK